MAGKMIKRLLAGVLTAAVAIPTNFVPVQAAEEGKALCDGIDLGAKAAHEGAEATKTHVATLGRAGTVGERSIGFPDAGAHGLDVIFNELATYIKTL